MLPDGTQQPVSSICAGTCAAGPWLASALEPSMVRAACASIESTTSSIDVLLDLRCAIAVEPTPMKSRGCFQPGRRTWTSRSYTIATGVRVRRSFSRCAGSAQAQLDALSMSAAALQSSAPRRSARPGARVALLRTVPLQVRARGVRSCSGRRGTWRQLVRADAVHQVQAQEVPLARAVAQRLLTASSNSWRTLLMSSRSPRVATIWRRRRAESRQVLCVRSADRMAMREAVTRSQQQRAAPFTRRAALAVVRPMSALALVCRNSSRADPRRHLRHHRGTWTRRGARGSRAHSGAQPPRAAR